MHYAERASKGYERTLIEEGMRDYASAEPDQSTELSSQDVAVETIDPLEVASLSDKIVKVYQRLSKYRGTNDRQYYGKNRYAYSFNEDSEYLDESDEKEVLDALPVIPKTYQAAVFFDLEKSGHLDEALELILKGRLPYIGSAGIEKLYEIMRDAQEEERYKKECSNDLDNDRPLLRSAVGRLPFLTYLNQLEGSVASAEIVDYVERFGFLDLLPKRLEDFPFVDRKELVAHLYRVGRPDVVARYLSKFPFIDHESLLKRASRLPVHEIEMRVAADRPQLSTTSVMPYVSSFRLPETRKIDILMQSPVDLACNIRFIRPEFHRYAFTSILNAAPTALCHVNLDDFKMDLDSMVERILRKVSDHTSISLLFENIDRRKRELLPRSVADRLSDLGFDQFIVERILLFREVDEYRVLQKLRTQLAEGNIDSKCAPVFDYLRNRYEREEVVEMLKALDEHFAEQVLASWARHVNTQSAPVLPEIEDAVYVTRYPWKTEKYRIEGSVGADAILAASSQEEIEKVLTREEELHVALEVCKYTHATAGYGTRFWSKCLTIFSPEEIRAKMKKLLDRREQETIEKLLETPERSKLADICGRDLAREFAACGRPELIYQTLHLALEKKPVEAFTRQDIAHGLAIGAREMKIDALETLLSKLDVDMDTPFTDPTLEQVWTDWKNPSISKKDKHEWGALDWRLDQNIRAARRLFGISPMEAKTLQHLPRVDEADPLELDQKLRPKNKEALFQALLRGLESDATLGADASIREKIKQGRELFGAGIMLAYMNRADVSRHDTVHFMQDIVDVYTQSGLSAKDFARNILLQVQKDGSSYEGGTSYHEFARVCQGLRKASFEKDDPMSVLNVLKRYEETLPEMRSMMDLLENDGMCASWMHLKNAYEAYTAVKRSELLDRLKEESHARMQRYIAKLAFHPNISMEAVFQFWNNTGPFLEIEDAHAPKSLHQIKKPSNYLTVAHLSWEAKDLRNALVGLDEEEYSALDRLQTLPPMGRIYTLTEYPENDTSIPENLHRILMGALGRQRDGIRGGARDPGKLFSTLGSILRGLGVEGKVQATTILESPYGLTLLKKYRPDIYTLLEEATFHKTMGMDRPEVGEHTYRIRLGRKSDPDMVVAGNDTASCMPFGSGKNNVYMFNPNCAQLVLERKNNAGKWRTVAQSVVTINQEIGRAAPELINLFQEQQASLGDLIDPSDFARKRYIACDNIETAKNEEGDRVRLIREAYERFWKEYLDEYAEKIGVSVEKVVAGQGYSPADLGLKSERNDTIPLVPMTYSDNLHAEHYVIETGLSDRDRSARARPYVRPIEVTDVYSIAHLESKAFKGTQLGYGIHQVQNNLMGIAIANEHFHRPNLSFIAQNEGKPSAAYLVAYEGVSRGEKMIYVDDMAAEERGNPAGGRVLLAFVESYMKGYQNEKEYPPILADMRDQTSFRLVQNQLEKLSRRAGMVSRMIELDNVKRGDEVMHKAVILVAHSVEELDRRTESIKQL